ncbi:MAG: mandelate racemase/muconate lactonizing enzyme family protein [Acidobacteria bacterium]|nr:mandelate racemase/muconate lactonizing enzyme family protein [Acidobacteriota bacterium]
MKSATTIVKIEQQMVFVPFHKAAEWAAGKRPGTTRLIVQVHTADGTIGVGETICLWEFVQPVLAHTIIPLALGADACDIEKLCARIEGAGYYHHQRALVAALAGFEMALWDIVGKQAEMPLYQLWGGAYRNSIPVIAYLQAHDPQQIGTETTAAVEAGFGTIKVKIGMSPESDLEIVKAARAAAPHVKLRADVNGAWTIGTAKRMMRQLEQYDLEYVEQPLPLHDLAGHAQLRKLFATPIALDESAYTIQDVFAILRAEAADVLLLDPHQSGGMWRCRKAAAIAEAAGIPVTFHSGAELGISTAAFLHLAASIPNMMLALDNQQPNLTDDVVEAPQPIQNGQLAVPAGAGLGVRVNAEKLRQYRTEKICQPYLDPERPDWFPTKPQY